MPETMTNSRRDVRSSRIPARTAVMVLGMHRSGTSAVTRVLNLLGCDGPRNLIPATESNPHGHWESEPVAALNDEIFNSAGSGWQDWQEFNPNWMKSAAFDHFLQRGMDVIEQEFGDSHLFVLKDPRICVLMPFWRAVLDKAGIKQVVVHTVRHPVEVIESLQKRNKYSAAASILLWLRYNLSAELATRDMARYFTSYDEILKSQGKFIDDSQSALNIYWPRNSKRVRKEIADFLTESARHHHHDPKDVRGIPSYVTDLVVQAYATLDSWAVDGAGAEAGILTLDDVFQRFAARLPVLEGAVADIEAADAKANALASDLRQSEAKLAEADKERDGLGAQVATLAEERDEARRLRGEVEAQVATLAEERDGLGARVATLAEERDEARRLRGEVEAQVATLAEERDGLEAQVATLAEERDEARRLRGEVEAQVATLTEERDGLEAQIATLAEERDEARRLRGEVEAQVATLTEERDGLEAQVATLAEERDEACRLDGEVEAQIVILTEERDEARRLCGEVVAQVTTFAEEREGLEAQVAALAKERDEARRLCGEVEAQVATLTEERDEGRHKETQYAKEVRDVTWRAEELAAHVDHQAREIATLRERLISDQRDIANFSRERSDFTAQIDRSHGEISKLREELSGRERRISDLERIVEDMRAEVQEQVEQGRAAALKMQDFVATVGTLTSEKESVERALAGRDRRIEQLVANIDESMATESRRVDEIKKLTGILSDTERKLDLCRKEADRASDELVRLKAESQSTDSSRRALEGQIAEHQDAIAALNDAIKSLIIERDAAIAQRDKEVDVTAQMSAQKAEYEARLNVKVEEIVVLTKLLQQKES